VKKKLVEMEKAKDDTVEVEGKREGNARMGIGVMRFDGYLSFEGGCRKRRFGCWNGLRKNSTDWTARRHMNISQNYSKSYSRLGSR